MAEWTRPAKLAELTESRLVEAFLEDRFPVGSSLPGERELAAQLGVTRPTLREALQRLSRDGWITIQQGRPTRVNDFWWEGNLNVLGAIVRYARKIPAHFVPDLLQVRLALAPAYTREAVEREAGSVAAFLATYPAMADSASEFASADWRLHLHLIRASGNPVYMLIFNGFNGFYVEMARRYFERTQSRAASRQFYRDLLSAAQKGDSESAARAAARAMQQSIILWQEAME